MNVCLSVRGNYDMADCLRFQVVCESGLEEAATKVYKGKHPQPVYTFPSASPHQLNNQQPTEQLQHQNFHFKTILSTSSTFYNNTNTNLHHVWSNQQSQGCPSSQQGPHHHHRNHSHHWSSLHHQRCPRRNRRTSLFPCSQRCRPKNRLRP